MSKELKASLANECLNCINFSTCKACVREPVTDVRPTSKASVHLVSNRKAPMPWVCWDDKTTSKPQKKKANDASCNCADVEEEVSDLEEYLLYEDLVNQLYSKSSNASMITGDNYNDPSYYTKQAITDCIYQVYHNQTAHLIKRSLIHDLLKIEPNLFIVHIDNDYTIRKCLVKPLSLPIPTLSSNISCTHVF